MIRHRFHYIHSSGWTKGVITCYCGCWLELEEQKEKGTWLRSETTCELCLKNSPSWEWGVN